MTRRIDVEVAGCSKRTITTFEHMLRREEMDELLDLAVRAAHQAGERLRERFAEEATGVDAKTSPTDLVSDADREAEELILTAIGRARPQDGVLAEEGGRETSESGLVWIVDPLDGTVNFLFRIPVWCVSIAVQDEDGMVAGVVHDPNHDETFTATRGGGARRNGRPISVSDCTELNRALVGTGFAYQAESRAVQAERLPRMLPRVRDIRRAGSAAIDLAWLACGRLDGFFEAPMNTWDKAAGVLLIAEAGGVVSELAAPRGDGDGVIGANPVLHDALRALVLG
jgi:myo-inositol-1(or 4)-monophosphatase